MLAAGSGNSSCMVVLLRWYIWCTVALGRLKGFYISSILEIPDFRISVEEGNQKILWSKQIKPKSFVNIDTFVYSLLYNILFSFLIIHMYANMYCISTVLVYGMGHRTKYLCYWICMAHGNIYIYICRMKYFYYNIWFDWAQISLLTVLHCLATLCQIIGKVRELAKKTYIFILNFQLIYVCVCVCM